MYSRQDLAIKASHSQLGSPWKRAVTGGLFSSPRDRNARRAEPAIHRPRDTARLVALPGTGLQYCIRRRVAVVAQSICIHHGSAGWRRSPGIVDSVLAACEGPESFALEAGLLSWGSIILLLVISASHKVPTTLEVLLRRVEIRDAEFETERCCESEQIPDRYP